MDNGTEILDPIAPSSADHRGGFRRLATFVTIVALLGAALAIARDAGTPAIEDNTKVLAEMNAPAVAEAGAPASLAPAQFFPPFQSLVCGILASIARFLPPFVRGIFNAIRAGFGCISPA